MARNIAVGVTGGIAAYKTCELVSRFKKSGYDVNVIMTDAAKEFVAPLTFETLSKNRVITGMFEKNYEYDVKHISVAEAADVFLVCPATANIVGKVANGIADDFLSTTIMATKAPVIFALAMNTNMYENPIFRENVSKLKKLGYKFVDAESGLLACGSTGKGRLADLDEIYEAVEECFYKKDLCGKNVLVSAGPTTEDIDPVRYITNHSSGKMGYEIARAAKYRGADVTLVSGPVNIKAPGGVNVINVNSARDMFKSITENFEKSDIVIKAAAVADYRPESKSDEKIKKSNGGMEIKLVRNPDILKEIGSKKTNQFLVGFCMETSDLIDNAKKKLSSKNLDMIVANSLKTEGAGFKSDTNVGIIIEKNGAVTECEKMSKFDLANVILDKIAEQI